MKTIRDAVRSGEPLDFTPFVDVHGHFGPWMDTVVPWSLDYGRLVGEMDRFGCDMVWMTASDPGYAAPMRVKNDFVFDLADAHPERIIPYCTLSANEPGACLAELKRCLDRGPCIGVKMHRYSQPPYTVQSDFLQPIFELLDERRLVYMNHCFTDIPALRAALERYPDVAFMPGHLDPAIFRLTADHPNLNVCTCAAMTPDSVTAELAATPRPDRLLVGSDFGLFCLSFGIGMIAYAEIDDSDKRRILGENAVRLMERTAWYDPSMLKCTSRSA